MAAEMTSKDATATARAISGGFVHLHLHSEYSLLDGGNRVDKLVARVKELGMNAVAVTDHGNLFGAAVFAMEAKEAGVHPILGVEAYVTPPDRNRHDRTYTGSGDGGYHLVLLAETREGWNNLLTLCSEAYLTGFYFKPRVDRELLAKHSGGLIAINGHLGSEIGEHLLAFEQSGDRKYWEKAVESARWHAETFGHGEPGNPARSGFFLEMQHHVAEQVSINKHVIALSEELGLPVVCDNDSHFLREEDHDAHDTLICISMGKIKSDTARLRYSPELYVKGPAEMRELFEREYGTAGRVACDNTVLIAERCVRGGGGELALGQNHSPVVRVLIPEAAALPRADDPAFGGDLTAWYKAYCAAFRVAPYDAKSDPDGRIAKGLKEECDRALRMLSHAGAVWRYGSDGASAQRSDEERAFREEVNARLERELKILSDKAISAYFLIVWDFVNEGRQRGIPAMARGSGVGTMVGYVLGLSNACPVRYGLLFERFTDPDRGEYPDIDIDLCQDGRAEVIDYVRRKYGHVAQIITFGTLKARAAIRDVARVLNVSLPVADRVAKLIPEQLNITLDEALQQEPELKKLREGDRAALEKINKDLPPMQQASGEQLGALIDNARTIEGQARHSSVHAAGVIVATRPLQEIVPLYKQASAGENEIVTQWDGPTCEKMGLLKMDFLGLRTLSVVERCKALIRATLGEEEIWKGVGRGLGDGGPHPLDLDRLTYADPRVFELFQRADTTGVFQFESGGMRRLLVEMKPDRLEDLIAANALFRPGPMDLIPDYNRRKHGQAPVPRVHEIVDRFTAETYGVMVYQEQVMQIVHGLGGVKLRDAYTLIKNISKKKHDKIEKERPKFVDGAQKQGLSKAQAEELFELILKFAGYGFNKSHSTGYAIVAYQTAYLKTYFPNQYMAAFLTYESGAQKVSDWIGYVEDCKKTRFVNGRVGVEVRPPDINLSSADFTVVFGPDEPRDALHGHVRFGLGAIKGVGDKVIHAAERERTKGGPFTSLAEFCERVLGAAAVGTAGGGGSGGAVLNKTALDALIKCGALDSLHGREHRAAMLASVENALSSGQKVAADKAAGQGGLFLGKATEPRPPSDGATKLGKADGAMLAKVTAWTEAETLAFEKEALGFYVSSHPLERWRAWSDIFATGTSELAKQLPHDRRIVLPGIVQAARTIVVRNGRSAGQKMAIVTIEDLHGQVEAVLFTDNFAKFGHLIVPDAPVFVLGRIDRSRAGGAGGVGGGAGLGADEDAGGAGKNGGTGGGRGGGVQIIVDRVVPIDGVPLQPGRLWVRVDAERLNGTGDAAMTRLAEILRGTTPGGGGGGGVNGTLAMSEVPEKGTTFPVTLVIDTAAERVELAVGPQVRVLPSVEMAAALAKELGEGCVKCVGGFAVEVTGANGGGDRKRWQKKAG